MARETGLSGKTGPARKRPGGRTPRPRRESQGAPGCADGAARAGDAPRPVGPAREGKEEAAANGFSGDGACAVATPRAPHRNVLGAGTSLTEKPKLILPAKGAPKARFAPGMYPVLFVRKASAPHDPYLKWGASLRAEGPPQSHGQVKPRPAAFEATCPVSMMFFLAG